MAPTIVDQPVGASGRAQPRHRETVDDQSAAPHVAIRLELMQWLTS